MRTHLQYIVSADPAYALHVRENAIELITAAVQLDRGELFETRADDVQRVAREVEPFVEEIEDYLGTCLLYTSDAADEL